METLTVGSLFSGIGGLDLGFERAGFAIKWQVEIDPYCRRVLHKHWPTVPCYEDVKTVGAHNLEPVDVLVGGFPCQDISNAGTTHEGGLQGLDGGRSGLWSEYRRIVGDLRPRYVVVENVSALFSRGFGRVAGDLADCGYDAEWACIPAAAVGAPHLRNRVFIVAYPQCEGLEGDERRVLANTREGRFDPDAAGSTWWQSEPNVDRVANGIPARVDRLRGLGNAVVPQVAQYVAECVRSHASGQVASR